MTSEEQLVAARVQLDRARIERAVLEERIRYLEEANEALRNQIAVLALAAGGGAAV